MTVDAALSRARRLTKYGQPEKELLDAIHATSPSTMTLAQAHTALVERYVRKWGNEEQEAALRLVQRECSTLGLALNRLS